MQKQNRGEEICCSRILKRKDAEGIITFSKAGYLLSPGSFFTKKLYLKQNGDFIAETICFKTKICIRNSKKFLKLLQLAFGFKKGITNGSASSIPRRYCSEFIEKHLCNSVCVQPTGSLRKDIFKISNMSCQVYKITPDKLEEHYHTLYTFKSLFNRNEEANMGKVVIEFKSNTRFSKCNFVVEIEIIRKTKINVMKSIKQRLVNCLHECSIDIQRYCSYIPTLKSKAEMFPKSNMEHLLSLDLFNWKTLGFQFVTPKHESFYKQIRRKNKCLPRV